MTEYRRSPQERADLLKMLKFLSAYLDYEYQWQHALPSTDRTMDRDIWGNSEEYLAARRAEVNEAQERLLDNAGVTNTEMNRFMQSLMDDLTRLGEFADKDVNW